MKWRRLASSPRAWVALVLVGALALEFGLRALGFGALPVTEAHRDLGWITLPDQSRPGHHGERLEINASGFRDRPWSATEAGAAGTQRIAFLGDSRLYGLAVQVEQGFARVVEAELQSAGAPVETMNFAQPGYGVEQMRRLYTSHVRAWRPDVVVVCVGSASIRPVPPPFEQRDFPLRRSVIRTATWDFLDQYLLRSAHSFDAAWERAGLRGAAEAAREGFRLARDEPFSAAAASLWIGAGETMRSLVSDVEASGGRAVVLVLPRDVELAAASEAKLAERWRACVRGLEVELVDAGPALRAQRGAFHAADPLHFSPAGHRAVADALLACGPLARAAHKPR
jgi:lysophospholipase L1-like esterase